MTPQESKLWYQYLRNYLVRFQRQRVIEWFIVDFFCSKAFLVVEVDGKQHESERGIAYDTDRTNALRRNYIEVMRINNEEIESDFFEVCRRIDNMVQTRLLDISKRQQVK